MACFSFHPRKLLTTGDGGMLTTANEEWDRNFRLWRQHSMGVPDTVRLTDTRYGETVTCARDDIPNHVQIGPQGNLIFLGIENTQNDQVIAGAILISLLAIVADLLLLALQVALNRGRSAVSAA